MIKQVLTNIKRYNSVSLDMIVLITLFLFILGCLLLSKNNFDDFSQKIKDKLEIAVFLKNDVKINRESVLDLKTKILERQNIDVKSIKFVDKKTALNNFIVDYPELKEQIDMLEENPLRNNFLIKLKDNRYKNIKQFVAGLASLDFIEDVLFSEDLIKNVEHFFKYMVRIGLILFTFFLVIIVWILNYTIKIDLHYKKLEFLLWRYLGANKWIECSFIFGEAFVLGVVAGILAIMMLFLFYYFISMFLFNIEFLNLTSMVIIFIVGIILAGIINFIVFKKSKNEVF